MNLKVNNKIMIIFLVSFLIVLFINIDFSHALSVGKVYLQCDKENIEIDEEVEVTLYIKGSNTAAFNSNLYFDDTKLEYISGPENTNVIENRVIFVWYDEAGGSNEKEGELAKFKFKAKENGTANFIVGGEFYAKNEDLIQVNFKGTQVQIGINKTVSEEQGTNNAVDNAQLQSLRINREGLIPDFEKNIYTYYLTIPSEVNQIEVLAVSENPNATVEINGNTNLKEGLNYITIKVISEDKTQSNIYTIQVTKTSNLELANTNLETLAIENVLLYPPFNTDITSYKAEVSKDVDNLKILAVPENENAKVEILGGDGIKEGYNLIKINVTAPDGITKRVYEVNVYKRNAEEELIYNEEQKANQEKLEEIYETEELNTEVTEEQKNNSRIKIIIFAIVAVLLIAIVAKMISLRKNRK